MKDAMVERSEFDDSKSRRLRRAALSAAARSLGGELGDHPTYQELEAVVDATADDVAREVVESHIAVCPSCAAELADLRAFAGRPAARAPRAWWFAAAAAVAIVVAFALLWPAGRRAVTPPRVQSAAPVSPQLPPEWQQLVDDARRSGRVSMPAEIRALAARDEYRGPESESTSKVKVSPSGTAIDEVQPRLTWSGIGADDYQAAIFDGDTEVARGPGQRETSWTVPTPLQRGKTYRWQVVARRGPSTLVLPAPPAPPAIFRIIDWKQHDELVRAQSQFPNDDVLLGVLFARAGVLDRAREHLASAHSSLDLSP